MFQCLFDSSQGQNFKSFTDGLLWLYGWKTYIFFEIWRQIKDQFGMRMFNAECDNDGIIFLVIGALFLSTLWKKYFSSSFIGIFFTAFVCSKFTEVTLVFVDLFAVSPVQVFL